MDACLAAGLWVGRDTVRLALTQAEPPPRKTPVRVAPRLGPFKAAVDEMLREDLVAPRKQRQPASRILARLADEHPFAVRFCCQHWADALQCPADGTTSWGAPGE
jgi:hypothetical protein